ncbi:hypothetical protein KIN20_025027 [Parelaphostrongylus tenuis]|uniref:Uncharacterized protein n=1 Tax=Parelaphostrongylus tenuis TaxID=148309 RepID=A0AAD5MUJ0_PARTN|nr:hypothetical protein KIN20_025027 [Parelaphostrongylus tenuis]
MRFSIGRVVSKRASVVQRVRALSPDKERASKGESLLSSSCGDLTPHLPKRYVIAIFTQTKDSDVVTVISATSKYSLRRTFYL